MSDIATTFVETLAARGVTLKARGKKGLVMIPKHAYGEMSADERQTLKQHKAAIIAVAREGKHATTTVEPKAAAPVEPPAPCAYCYQAPCIGEEHPAFATLHAGTSCVRTQEVNEDAVDQLIAYAQGWPTSRMIEKARAREPKLTAEEQRQAELRRKLGWDAGSRRV